MKCVHGQLDLTNSVRNDAFVCSAKMPNVYNESGGGWAVLPWKDDQVATSAITLGQRASAVTLVFGTVDNSVVCVLLDYGESLKAKVFESRMF